MKKTTIIILLSILIVIASVVVGLVLYFRRSKDGKPKKDNRPKYAPMSSNGFDGISISVLAQPKKFYSDSRQKTLKYLSGVYPTAMDSLNKLSDMELASFYNSLWFYYHCEGEYHDKDLGSLFNPPLPSDNPYNDQTWDGLPCASEYPIPYTPQGMLYNFYTYNKYNVTNIYSDSDSKKIYLQPKNSGSTRPGNMGTYINNKYRSSGIMWWPPRTIQRNVWFPNGLDNKKELKPNQKDNWIVTVGKTPKYSYPNGWYGKLGDNQYIEVTHSPSNTGDSINQSPWWWYNVCPGSGIFLNIGKTLAVKNKISGLFELSRILSKTSNGQTFLKKWFNTTDPYDITWGVIGLCGYNTVTKQKYCDFSKLACGIACGPIKIGFANAANIEIKKFYDETKKLGTDEHGHPTKKAIRQAIDLAVNNEDYYLAHTAVNILPDEIVFFLAMNVGIDTLQLYEDPSPNDDYVFEIIDTRIPKKYKEAAKKRDYSGFLHIVDPNAQPWSTTATQNRYKMEAIKEYLQEAFDKEWLSVRDPLDIYNEKKVKKCDGAPLFPSCDGEYARMQFCSNVPLANAWKCLYLGNQFTGGKCLLRGSNPTC